MYTYIQAKLHLGTTPDNITRRKERGGTGKGRALFFSSLICPVAATAALLLYECARNSACCSGVVCV